MTAVRREASLADLAGLMRAAFGASRRLMSVTRLANSSKKGVYRAVFDDGFAAVVYLWSADEDYWTAGAEPTDIADPFSHASGIGLFLAAQARLDALGVRTPRLYFADRDRRHYPADAAIVEDVPGPSLEELLHADPAAARPVTERLAEILRVMRRGQAAAFGKVLYVGSGGTARGDSCQRVVLDRALSDLAEASARDTRIGRACPALEDLLRRHADMVGPRQEYSLVHGELGPDHILVAAGGQPVIIDIEGLMYFDMEWEHVFLRLRFGPFYPLLRDGDLDEYRLRLYRLAMHLSLVAGPVRLLDGDYPDREPMREIAEYNLGEVLTLVGG